MEYNSRSVTHPVLIVALAALLGTEPPTPPPDAPRLEIAPAQPRYVPPEPAPPPSARPRRHRPVYRPAEQPVVLLPTLLGLGLGVTSAVLFKLAADDAAQLDRGQLVTRSQVAAVVERGSANQRMAIILGLTGVAAFGFAGYMAFGPASHPPASVGIAPTPGGGVAVVSGALP